MAFYIPRIPLFIVVAVLAACTVIAGASAASAASCKPGQIQLIVKGKATCPKTTTLGGSKKPGTKASNWVEAITVGKVLAKGFKSKFAVPSKLRRATPTLAQAADPKSFKTKRILRLAIRAAAAPAVVATLEIPGPSKTTDGVELSSTAHLTRLADGSVEARLVLEAKANGYTLRYRASTNSGWTYAIHLDFNIPNQTFASTDCPPGAELPSFTGDIVNYIYTKQPDAPFRPIWSGSTESDMRLIEMSPVSDVVGASSLPTTANWGLIGTFD